MGTPGNGSLDIISLCIYLITLPTSTEKRGILCVVFIQGMFENKILDYPDGSTLHYVVDRKEVEHVHNWEYNRPPDETRVQEIMNSNKTDGIIYIGRIPSGENDAPQKYVCYEGWHRLSAFKRGAGSYALIQVMWEASHEIIAKEFLRINKAIPVPELFFRQVDSHVRVTILEAINRLGSTFPDHCSPAKNPHKPNFNRDSFTDELTRAVQEGHISHVDIYNQLMVINNRIKETAHLLTLPAQAKTKCEKTGCYLFVLRPFDRALAHSSKYVE